LVVTVRDLSINASLAASTLTPDITAPELSFTAPAMVLCAEAAGANKERINNAARTDIADFMVMRLPSIHPKSAGVNFISSAIRCQWGLFLRAYFCRRLVCRSAGFGRMQQQLLYAPIQDFGDV
jgi:hypothetical protein